MTKISCGKCGECLAGRPEKCVHLTIRPKKKLKPGDADWSSKCVGCGATPTVYTGHGDDSCGPCTFGESETAGGNW